MATTEEREGLERRAWLHGDEVDLDLGVAEVARWVAESTRIVVLTGAGISTDSGIPDFRGPNGVWTRTRRPRSRRRSTTTCRRPRGPRRGLADAPRPARRGRPSPTPATGRWSTLERPGPAPRLVTQNIDGLHQVAGSDPDRVVEVHGTMREVDVPRLRRAGPMRAGARPGAGRRGRPAVPRLRRDPEVGARSRSARASIPADIDAAPRPRPRAATCCWPSGSTLAVYPVADVVPIAAAGRRPRGHRQRPTHRAWTTWPTPSCGARSRRHPHRSA